MITAVKCCMCELELEEYEDEPIFDCPKCKTGSYLMDLGEKA